jgi:hypothetical protein
VAYILGTGFAAEVALVAEVDVDIPHGSLACMREFRRAVRPDRRGNFIVAIHPRSQCRFCCDEPYRAFVSSARGGELARSPPVVPCWTH